MQVMTVKLSGYISKDLLRLSVCEFGSKTENQGGHSSFGLCVTAASRQWLFGYCRITVLRVHVCRENTAQQNKILVAITESSALQALICMELACIGFQEQHYNMLSVVIKLTTNIPYMWSECGVTMHGL